jgi:hypothetical protein
MGNLQFDPLGKRVCAFVAEIAASHTWDSILNASGSPKTARDLHSLLPHALCYGILFDRCTGLN